jgi:hypothetical protein
MLDILRFRLTFFGVVDIIKIMNTITIPKNLIKTKSEDLVVISRKEYESMKAHMLPTFRLEGKEADKLDKLVKDGLREHKKGEMIRATSLKEALKLYGKKGKKN